MYRRYFKGTLAERLAHYTGHADENGCRDWTAARTTGYGVLRVDGRNRLVHRLVYEMAHGPIPDGLEVCHRCDRPSCLALEHLFLGTHAENMHDRDAKGRVTRGAGHWTQRTPEKVQRALTSEQVEVCKVRHLQGETLTSIAADMGVTRHSVARYVRGQRHAAI